MKKRKAVIVLLAFLAIALSLAFAACSAPLGSEPGINAALKKDGKSSLSFCVDKSEYASLAEFDEIFRQRMYEINNKTTNNDLVAVKSITEEESFYQAVVDTRKVDLIEGYGSINYGNYEYVMREPLKSRTQIKNIYEGSLQGQRAIILDGKSAQISVSDSKNDLGEVQAKTASGKTLALEQVRDDETMRASENYKVLSFMLFNMKGVAAITVTVPGKIEFYSGNGILVSDDTVKFDTFDIVCNIIDSNGELLKDQQLTSNVGFLVYEQAQSPVGWILLGIGIVAVGVLLFFAIRRDWFKRIFRSKAMREAVKNYRLLVMLIPGIALAFIFAYIPMAGLYTAFTSYDPNLGIFGSEFIGFKNFVQLFTDPSYKFGRLFRNTVGISFFKFIIQFPSGVIFALMLNELRNKAFKKTAQTASYLPYFISWVVISGMMLRLFATDTGSINAIIELFGGKRVNWYGEKWVWWPIFVISSLWKGVGWGSIIFLAAIPMINNELYESCEIDGGGFMRKIWTVTLPGIFPTVALSFVVSIGGLIRDDFEQIYALLGSEHYHLNDVTEVFGTLIFKTVMEGNSNSYAISTALGLFQSVIGLLLVLGANYIVKRKDVMGLW